MDKPIGDAMRTEFVPPFIDGMDYKFPIRTAICKARNIADQPKLFDNHNIAFFYEKMMGNDFQECNTDVKWDENEDSINVFIRELLLIIKCDILQHNGILSQTSIVWFRPLSFSGNTKRIYERSWKRLAKEILFTDNVVCYTESEAPYYYFAKRNIIKNTDSVAVIDIGGGSTDYVYFCENKPVSASSVHFGCNVLWGNGHSGFGNVRENGIYNKYIDSLNWRTNDDLRTLESEMFSMSNAMVSYLHDYNVRRQYSEVVCIEDAMDKPIGDAMRTEFVPPFIDGMDYKFPIRTAICKARNIADQPKLFDNHNIAFFYEKMMGNDFQECNTDVKWDENEDSINVFIRELLLIIKCDILQHNGILSQTSIVWFRPLSFSGNTKRIYERSWKRLAKEILFTDNVVCYTESEAPYYYFAKRNIIKNTDSVAVIDIGGGSTDYVYFCENKPVSASSVHFGCNVLWGNGHSGFGNVRENGIYNKYIDSLNWRTNDDLRTLESEMKVNSHCSTTDIINFWLSNSKYNDIVDRLHDDFLPLFTYHFTAIIYYVATMYKYKRYAAPRSIVFSGNGSRYIDNFITEDNTLIEQVITAIFSKVYGKVDHIHVVMPDIRKESTCYGGLYRPVNAEDVPAVIYHGVDMEYDNVGQMNADSTLQSKLLLKYKEMNDLYGDVLDILKRGCVIDNSVDLNLFKSNAMTNYKENLSTHYLTDVSQKYTNDDDVCNDAAFFIPVVDKIFEMTKLV
uniref:Ppx/GppA phosphatase family protein n=1 Tax=Prevotella sp. TaxID=59823 RepID=UPI004028E6B5